MALRAIAASPLKYAGDFAFANLPSAASYSGYEAFVTDWGVNGTLARSNGTRWLPVNGRALLKRANAVTGITNSVSIVIQSQLPAGCPQAGDSVVFDILGLTKSGTTDSGLIAAYAGTAGTTSDTNILPATNTIMAAANRSASSLVVYKIISDTSVQRVGSMNGSGLYGGGGVSSVAAPSAVTVTDMSANALYFSFGLTSSGTTDTLALQDAVMWHIPA